MSNFSITFNLHDGDPACALSSYLPKSTVRNWLISTVPAHHTLLVLMSGLPPGVTLPDVMWNMLGETGTRPLLKRAPHPSATAERKKKFVIQIIQT